MHSVVSDFSETFCPYTEVSLGNLLSVYGGFSWKPSVRLHGGFHWSSYQLRPFHPGIPELLLFVLWKEYRRCCARLSRGLFGVCWGSQLSLRTDSIISGFHRGMFIAVLVFLYFHRGSFVAVFVSCSYMYRYILA